MFRHKRQETLKLCIFLRYILYVSLSFKGFFNKLIEFLKKCFVDKIRTMIQNYMYVLFCEHYWPLKGR